MAAVSPPCRMLNAKSGTHVEICLLALAQALDIFAQFFVSPLMKEDSSDRELQSIESEFRLSSNNDDCRLQQLWCHTSKRGRVSFVCVGCIRVCLPLFLGS